MEESCGRHVVSTSSFTLIERSEVQMLLHNDRPHSSQNRKNCLVKRELRGDDLQIEP